MSLNQQATHLKHREGAETGTKYIAIASGKGGVGKTILSLSIGKSLSDSGKKVLIIDADFGLSNIHLMLGITPQKNLAHFFFGDASFEEIVVKINDFFSFISSGNGIYELAKLPKDQVINLIRRLQELAEDNYDYVIFDTPPGIHDDTIAVVSSADFPLVITTPEPTAVADAYALIKIINRENDTEDFYLVVNKVENDKEGKKVYESIRLLAERYTSAKLNHVGNIKYRRALIRKIIEQNPFESGFMDDVYNILSNMSVEVSPRRKSFWESVMTRLLGR
ncbi:MinD/ParA family protein [Hydrogenivirga sp. 128-5-R1-1]|uniref:MinD/ParA family protein n=1 Tax=Hydrogenivirga sp. 128-5-R1-1 TaxID=392423 RepID=UPI00015F1703|nr:MinD/ParA family protein [Hydrogenivirga sp. 128-5-R1-1]EDP76221.1 septum site-determining protein MinD [Hydrogenivirga sp. 128-5-R1-1]